MVALDVLAMTRASVRATSLVAKRGRRWESPATPSGVAASTTSLRFTSTVGLLPSNGLRCSRWGEDAACCGNNECGGNLFGNWLSEIQLSNFASVVWWRLASCLSVSGGDPRDGRALGMWPYWREIGLTICPCIRRGGPIRRWRGNRWTLPSDKMTTIFRQKLTMGRRRNAQPWGRL